jgi:NADH-quinone oxidoreductase subunit H
MTAMSLFAAEFAYWQTTIFKLLMAFVAVLLPAGGTVYLYLFKMVSFMQSRLGPMEAGPYGTLQLVAELGKNAQKEDIVPARADAFVYKAAPYVVLVSTFLLVLVVPWGPDSVFVDFDTGIFFALAVSSISVIGILMAGWASASKYSLLGGLRAAGQLIAYELPLVLAVVGVVIQAGTLSMQGIVFAQIGPDPSLPAAETAGLMQGEIFGWGGLGNPFILTQLVGFFIFMIAVQAELTQVPFDMPIAESELVSGYMTEYSGFRFLLFFIGEFATANVFAFLASVMFLGGWSLPPFIADALFEAGNYSPWMNLVGPLVMGGKMLLLTFIIYWVRFTYPRFREDQLQKFAWKFLIPLSLVNIAVTGLLKVVL